MLKSSLIRVINTLSTRERSRFREYVHSPYFNKNEKIRKLCDHVLDLLNANKANALNKPKVYQTIYGKEPFRELRLNNLISDLLQLLYDFLADQHHQEQNLLQKNELLECLLDRELHDLVDRNGRRYRKLLDEYPLRNHEHYFLEYLYHERLDSQSLAAGKRGYNEHLQHKSDQLDIYYWSNKLRIACDMASRNVVVNARYDCHYLDDLLENFRQNRFELQAIPVLQVYYKTHQMITETNDSTHYFALKELLAQHNALFPPAELRVLYNYALNYCVKQINFGQHIFHKEILDLYRVLLEKKIIFKNGYLTQWSYINISAAGIRLREFEWTAQFIHNYAPYLLPEVRDNAYTYNLSSLYFEKKDYQAALGRLHEVEFTDAFYHMGAKLIQLKSYYELEETEPFFALLEASRQYLSRNRQLSDYQKQSYGNFLKIANRIQKLALKKGIIPAEEWQNSYEKLQQQLNDPSPLASKNWLRGVIEEMG
ncbi:MAG: hypothetical protein DHS20C18_26520 [Saprospiraceae bacterium]|nr:MAG: hypothetical protein DHS20C18_26520 [Saprospiraceae bacterium]